MKKVTVNGVDHELSPDSPRSRSHVELLQDMVTSINNLETGTSPDGLELTSTDAAVNVITSASNDATTTSSVAAMTFKNTVAHASNDLEYNFTDNTDASLLKIDNEGDVTIAGSVTCAGLSSSGATTALTSTSANLITSATSDANTTVAVAGLTFKNTTAHTSGDLEFEFQKSTGGSLLSIDNEGQADLAGSFTCTGGVATDGLTTPVAGAFTTATTGGTLADATNYYYRISAINDVGESLACAEVTQATGAGPTGTHTITAVWGTVVGATGYNVYGRTTGAEQLIASVAQGTLSYTDTGSISPSGALPTHNTTSGLRMTALTPNVITSATNASNASATVAATTFKNTAALDANDLEFNFVRSDDTSLLKIDKEGDTTAAGTITGTDIYGSSVRSATAATLPVYSSVADGANTVIRLAALNDMTNGSAKLLSVGDNAGTSYAEKCYFDYDGAFCKSGGDGLKVDRIDHFNAVGIGLKYAIGTAGSGTGITAVNSGVLAHVVHKVTVTHAALTAAATTETVTLWTVPAKTRVLRVVADVTASFTGGGTTACTIEVGVGGSTDTYLTWFAAHSGAVTKGLVEADLGASLVNSGAGTYAFPAWAGGAIVAKFDSATANVSEFDAGSVTFYIECATYL